MFILGAGQAGSQAAVSLREAGFEGRIVLLGAEPEAPYMRPPLSKGYLQREVDEDRIALRPAEAYADLQIDFKPGIAVEGLEVAASRLRLANGLRLEYDTLILATGSRARTLDVPGANAPEVLVLRTWAHARALRRQLGLGRRVVVIGGGYLGLEVAAAARGLGDRVRVLEAAPRVLSRVTSPELSAFFHSLHRESGVDVRCGIGVAAFEGTDRLESVACEGGRFAADLAVVAVGALPNDELAREAGIACDDGILVDEACRTSAGNIFAIGDCCRFPDAASGERVRLESVQNAIDQAHVAARNACGGAARHRKVPWFWTQQYDVKLQTAGRVHGYDAIEWRGDPLQRRFAIRYLRAGELVAVDAVNQPAEFLAARKALAQRLESPLSPGAQAA